jgi:chemotaxis protein MotB
MAEPNQAPIIVIKKVVGHGGHHGGAWKVAYADFVTAMMALFIVLWLLSSSDQVKKAVGGYFQDPTGSGKLMGSSMTGSGGAESVAVSKDNMDKLKDVLEQAMKEMPNFQQMKSQVEIIVTGEGLRVELLETDKGMFFESGRGEPTQGGADFIKRLASELGKLPNKLLIEGHTDAKPFPGDAAYTNWELSTDRANAARRLMQQNGVRADQVTQVRGYGDQHLRNPKDPLAASNRRISVIVGYLNRPVPKPEAAGKPSAGQAAAEPPKHH